ncbi:MAG: TlyA family RNA methyltransferase [Eubacteriales bacterium]|nr:TlyA family RNA methyltransferase [Eubacteriales bacterium]
MAKVKLELAEQLVALGLAGNDKEARAIIMAGKALVNDRPARTGMKVSREDDIRLRGGKPAYLARGGVKLAGALEHFGASPKGRVCLDAGASTGGFTDCLLKHGAKLVYAVDAGFGQLLGSLRQDSRVKNLERTNLSDPALLSLDPRPDYATCDLSYLSLRESVPIYQGILGGRGTLICLVKPLFEVDDALARRTGVIEDSAYTPMLTDLAGFLNSLEGVAVNGVCPSPVRGNGGTVEFFFHINFGLSLFQPALDKQIAKSVERAVTENTDV